MKRKERKEFDQIVERYLPRVSDEEIESARGRFILMLKQRHELQEALDNFRTPEPVSESKSVSLGLVDQLVLTSVYLMKGDGSTLGIVEKVNELMPGKVFDAGSVFVSLDRLERGKLITSRITHLDDEKKKKVMFTITPAGERMLRTVGDGLTHLLQALRDLA
jgi:DNA-binding PadR family transcriptional regulator